MFPLHRNWKSPKAFLPSLFKICREVTVDEWNKDLCYVLQYQTPVIYTGNQHCRQILAKFANNHTLLENIAKWSIETLIIYVANTSTCGYSLPLLFLPVNQVFELKLPKRVSGLLIVVCIDSSIHLWLPPCLLDIRTIECSTRIRCFK